MTVDLNTCYFCISNFDDRRNRRLMAFLTSFALLFHSTTQVALAVENPLPNTFANICNVKIDSYRNFDVIKSDFYETVSIGSDVNIIIQGLETAGFKQQSMHGDKIVDLVGGVDVADFIDYRKAKKPKPAHYHNLIKICDQGNDNQDVWTVRLLSDSSGITGRELVLFFEDTNFKERGLPFRFEHAREGKPTITILNSLVPAHAPMVDLDKIMAAAGAKKRVISKPASDEVTVRYDYHPDAANDLRVRAGYIDSGRYIIANFNKNDELLEITASE